MTARQVRRHDRFWAHPEVTAEVCPLLPDGPARDELLRLIEAGEPRPIREWLSCADLPPTVRRAIGSALPPEDAHPALFDEILIGCVRYRDGAGTADWVLSRRVGSRFRHRVYFDGSGAVAMEWDTPRPLTRRQFEGLTRARPWLDRSADDGGCEVEIESIWEV